MVDYLKLNIVGVDPNTIMHNPKLEFHTYVSERTGELSTKHIAKHHFCRVIVYDSGKVYFTGSLHKLWNSVCDIQAPNYDPDKKYNGFNGNQFTLTEIKKATRHLEDLFETTADNFIIQNIEFGINTTPAFNPDLYLKGLIDHKRTPFEFKYANSFAQVEHNRFNFKIYNKSKQYGMTTHTLRVELKIKRNIEIAHLAIKTLQDINMYALKKAEKRLLSRFDEVFHYDYTIDRKNLSKPQLNAIERYSNPRYWTIDLKPNHRNRHKKNLNRITLHYSNNLHQKIKQEIIKNCSMINQLSEAKSNPKKELLENKKCSIINTLNIQLKPTLGERQKIAKKARKILKKKRQVFRAAI